MAAPRKRLERLRTLRNVLGAESRTLGIGPWQVTVSGLDDTLASALDRAKTLVGEGIKGFELVFPGA